MNGYTEPVLPMVHVKSVWSPYFEVTYPSSGAWYSANGAVYLPIIVPTTCVARRMFWANGATVNASYTVEAGIYASTVARDPGARIVSTGSVNQGTASQVQFSDITDTTLGPGHYWLYMSCSTTSATFFRSDLATARYNEWIVLTEASVAPGSAPATATPAEPGSSSFAYLFGFATTASP